MAKAIFQFGEQLPGFNVPVLNERAIADKNQPK